MTTIATDGKTMAGDGLVTSGSTIFGHHTKKVRHLSDGRLVGAAGRLHDFAAFVEWLEGGGVKDDKPKLDENFEAIMLTVDGACYTFDENCHAALEEVPTATGSGRAFAMAAMDLGKTPEEAVAYAMTRDTATGGTITVLELQPQANLRAA